MSDSIEGVHAFKAPVAVRSVDLRSGTQGRARARAIAIDLNAARECALELRIVRNTDDGITLARRLDLSIALVLTHDFDLELEPARDSARDLVRDFERARAFKLSFKSTKLRMLKRTDAILALIGQGCAQVAESVVDYGQDLKEASLNSQAGQRVGVLPNLILRRIVQLLPAGHRPRYYEEFRSELSEVAESGNLASQILYVTRVLWRASDLRRTLLQSLVLED